MIPPGHNLGEALMVRMYVEEAAKGLFVLFCVIVFLAAVGVIQ